MKTSTIAVAVVLTSLLQGFVPLTSLRAADTSATAQIQAYPVFDDRLEWIGPTEPPPSESAELLRAIQAFGTNKAGELKEFIAAHPQSAWVPSLRVNLADFYEAQGYFTQAINEYEAAWQASKDNPCANAQSLAARSAGQWVSLLAALGQKEALQRALKQIEGSSVPLGIYGETVATARSRLSTMQDRPSDAFKCGLIALRNLGAILHVENTIQRYMLHTASPDGGFTLGQLLELGQTNGLALEAVRRPTGATLVVPCIAHWKYDHYAVIASVKDGLCEVVDSSTGIPTRMAAAAVDAESSGIFLLPRANAPAGWPRLTPVECAAIRGGCYGDYPNAAPDGSSECETGDEAWCFDTCNPPAANDGAMGGARPCPNAGSGDTNSLGMPQWRVSEPYINLWLDDTPLRYRLSSGQWMSLTLSYKQRASAEGWNSSLPGFGPNWFCSWLGSVSKDSSGNLRNYMAGGGVREFQPNVPDYRSGRILLQAYFPSELPGLGFAPTVGLCPIISSPLGSQNRYGSAFNTASGARYFLTHRTDRYGRSVRYNYTQSAQCIRLTTVYDIDGRTNSITYGNTQFPNLITAITNPYNQVCYFNYDALGRLTNIVDAMGMSTTFQYDNNNLVRSMTTPYGTTTFQSFEGPGRPRSDGGGNSQNRSLLITEANGTHQLYTYCGEGPWDYCGGDGEAQFRNSYHWNRAQFALIPASHLTNYLDFADSDYYLGSIQHWLHEDASMGPVCDTASSQAGPLDPLLPNPQRSKIRSFWYQGQTMANVRGTLKRLTTVWDASWVPFTDLTRNSRGRPLTVTYYNTDGTSASYTNKYDKSGTYLQTEYGPRGERVRGYGYKSKTQPNLLTSVTNALNEVIAYTHDKALHVTSITFPSGLIRTNVYYADGPSQGFLQMQADIGIRTNYFTYTNGNVYTQTNELGLVITNTWDDLNRLVSTAYPDSTTVSNHYDRLDVVGVKDRLDQWTAYAFNEVRQLVAMTNVNKQVTLIDYCNCGSPSVISNLLGTRWLSTQHSYDIAGRLTNTIYADGYQVSRTYDENSLLQVVEVSGGRKTSLDYARHGLEANVANASMESADGGHYLYVSRQFDEYGRVVSSVDRNAVTTTTEYDLLDRIVRRQIVGIAGLVQSSSGPETFVYDARGLTNYFNASRQPTFYVRDPAGRELFVTNANLEVVQYTHNPSDRTLTLTDGKNHATIFKYDEYGQVTNKLDANGAEVFRYQYDANGRMTNRWQAGGVRTFYSYDAIGNLTNVVYPTDAALTCAFQYDDLNRLTRMTDSYAVNSFTWTDGNQLAGETGPWLNSAVNYQYENCFPKQLSVTQPNASPWIQTYAYDGFGRLTNVASPAGWFGYQYEARSGGGRPTVSDLVSRVSYPPGGYSSRTYDDLGRLHSITLVGPLGDVPDYHGYTYDFGSQRRRQVFAAGNYVNYNYDNIGQLTNAVGFEPDNTARPHEQFGYMYDAAGNLSCRANNGVVMGVGVNNLNELTAISRSASGLTVAGSSSAQATSVKVNNSAAQIYSDNTFAKTGNALVNGNNSFQADGTDAQGRTATTSVSVNLPSSVNYIYDARGNLTSDGRRTFEYDDENQLKRVTITNASMIEFEHDGLLRRRIRKEYTWSGNWVPSKEVHYIYDRQVVLQERDVNNVPQVSYTRGNDLSGELQEAGGIEGLLARTDNLQSTHVFYHSDGNGNITSMFDSTGAVVARYAYDPFGSIIAISGTLATANLYRFSSKECDPTAGLIYYLYRYYDPNLQRWLNQDPLGEYGGLNLYQFVYNNPVNFFDPDGLWGVQIGGINFGYGDPAYVFDGVDWDGYWGDVGDTTVGELKGAGSELSFGLYQPCYTSALQKQGGYVGTGLAMAGETLAGGAAGWKSAGKQAFKKNGKNYVTDFSHSIPANRLPGGRNGALDKFLTKTKLNGNYVTPKRHYKHDPAYWLNEEGWKKARTLREFGPKWPGPLQALDRIPRFPAGIAIGAGYAAGGFEGGPPGNGCY